MPMTMPRWADLPSKLKAELRAKAARRASAAQLPIGIFARATYRNAGVRFEVVRPEFAPDTWKLLVLVGPRVQRSSIADIRKAMADDARKRPAPWEGRGRQE